MDWKDLLKNVAPVLGTALGGPLGGMAVTAIGDALRMPKASQEVLKNVLSNPTPEQLISIKNAEQDFAFKMQQLGFGHAEAIEKLNVQIAQTDAQDRASARQMQLTTKSLIVPFLTILIVSAFILTVEFALLGYVRVDTVLAGTLVGYLSAKCEQVINYHFGSTQGSRDKDAMLARVRQQAR